jgi:hypothetical protein
MLPACNECGTFDAVRRDSSGDFWVCEAHHPPMVIAPTDFGFVWISPGDWSTRYHRDPECGALQGGRQYAREYGHLDLRPVMRVDLQSARDDGRTACLVCRRSP